MDRPLSCAIDRLTFCCGIQEIGNFKIPAYGDYEQDINYRLSAIATTTDKQKTAIKRLRALGFKKVSRFRRLDTKRYITLWFRKGTRKKPKALIKVEVDEDNPWTW